MVIRGAKVAKLISSTWPTGAEFGLSRCLGQRFLGSNHTAASIDLVLRSALARVSKDGHKRDVPVAILRDARRAKRRAELLRMRSASLSSMRRSDWFHGIDRLARTGP